MSKYKRTLPGALMAVAGLILMSNNPILVVLVGIFMFMGGLVIASDEWDKANDSTTTLKY